jgi:hypothetical protein
MPFGLGSKKNPSAAPGAAPAGERSLADLIDATGDAWPLVEDSVGGAVCPVEVLPGDRAAGESTLRVLQITNRSVLGTIALNAGGLLVDHGWLRILGSGHPKIGGGLREWNASLGGVPLDPPLGQAIIVAYDAVGGFYALNGGKWPGKAGGLYYFAPDTRQWEAMDIVYSWFVSWAMSKRLPDFYDTLRWPGWEAEVEALGPDQALSIYPPLGFEPSPETKMAIAERSRRAVPARELWAFGHEVERRLTGTGDPETARFKVT